MRGADAMAAGVGEARVERARLADLADALDRARLGLSDGSPAVVVKLTHLSGYPGTAAVFFACHLVTLSVVTEAEGAAVTVTVRDGIAFALNLGAVVPPEDSLHVAVVVDGLYVFRYDGTYAP
jgi:hypothetical protein